MIYRVASVAPVFSKASRSVDAVPLWGSRACVANTLVRLLLVQVTCGALLLHPVELLGMPVQTLSYLLDATGQFLPPSFPASYDIPCLSQVGFLPGFSAPAPGLQRKVLKLHLGCLGLSWAPGKDSPCFLKGMYYISWFVSVIPWRTFVLLLLCSRVLQ